MLQCSTHAMPSMLYAASVTADQPSQHARWRPSVLLARETVVLTGVCFSAQAGSAGRATPCWRAPMAAATKPEVNLDCVRAAARGRVVLSVPRRSPPPVSRYSKSTGQRALAASASGRQHCSSGSSSTPFSRPSSARAAVAAISRRPAEQQQQQQ